METIQEALQEAISPMPSNYGGVMTELRTQGWARVFGRHRDSDNIEESNYQYVWERFSENPEYKENEDYREEGSSHWAVGWTDTLLVRALKCKCEDWEDSDWEYVQSQELWHCRTCDFHTRMIQPIFHEAFEYAQRLEDYPLLDEERYSRLEYEELLDYIENEMFSAMTDEMKDDDSFAPEAEDIARYLFDVHSVSGVDDISYEWIADALVAQYQKKEDE